MLALLFALLSITGWLLVGYQVIAMRRPRSTTRLLAYQRAVSVGLLWLSQAMALLYAAYCHTWWVWMPTVRWLSPRLTALTFPKWARFTAVPYQTYPISCCLLE